MICKRPIPIASLCFFLFASSAIGASLEKAKMFRQHGLVSEAKKELIEVIFSRQNAKNKGEAYYILGTMAFEQNNISAALETWTRLIADFPNSDQAKLVKDRIKQLSEIVGEESRTVVENAIAQSYLRHADFWSEEDRHKKFMIDSSYIPNVEVAIAWYDKVIQEFPQTDASRRAYEGKMLTLIGRMANSMKQATGAVRQMERESDFLAHGSLQDIAKESHLDIFKAYMPRLLSTFSMFEKDHPNASSLQAFRYQIAQRYWMHENLDMTTKWLKLIVEKSGEEHTFYRDLAERRLKRLEE